MDCIRLYSDEKRNLEKIAGQVHKWMIVYQRMLLNLWY